MKHEEHLEQVKFVQRVRHTRHGIIVYSVPNGGDRKYREAVRLKAEGTLSGIPDIVIAYPSAPYHGLYLEFKTAKGKASEKQKAVMARLIDAGYKAVIVRSCEEAWETLLTYLEIRDEHFLRPKQISA